MTFEKKGGDVRMINAAPPTAGKILYEEFLKPLDMSPARLAELMDTSYKKIWEIIKNERDITLEEATQLSIVFNTDASFWMKLQELREAWFNKKSKGIQLDYLILILNFL